MKNTKNFFSTVWHLKKARMDIPAKAVPSTTLRYVTSYKIDDLNYTAGKYWNLAKGILILNNLKRNVYSYAAVTRT